MQANLKLRLMLYFYKIQIYQQSKVVDFDRRVRGYVWLKENLDEDACFLGRLITWDEAYFALTVCTNRQNLKFGLQKKRKKPWKCHCIHRDLPSGVYLLRRPSLMLFFFETPNGQTIVIGDRYSAIVSEYSNPEIDNSDLAAHLF